MNRGELNVLIVGAGFMGEVHAKAYRNINGVEVYGIVDKNPSRALDFSNKFGCKSFNDLKDALSSEVDFVDVCLPTLFHKEAIFECFRMDKDVICEKPISLSYDEAQLISEASEKYGRKLMIAHVVRFWPEYYKLSEMVHKGVIKDIKTLTLYRYGAPPKWSEGNWMLSDRKSGGIIYDLAIHDIDYAISLFGMPEWIFARKSKIGEDYTAYVNAILGYKDVNVLIESGFIMAGSYPFTSGFRLSTGEITLEYVNKSKKGLIMFTGNDTSEKRLQYDDFDPYQKELEYFIRCIRQDKKPVTGSAKDAANAVKVAGYMEISAMNSKKILISKTDGGFK